jgi:hypothetical protein
MNGPKVLVLSIALPMTELVASELTKYSIKAMSRAEHGDTNSGAFTSNITNHGLAFYLADPLFLWQCNEARELSSQFTGY